MAFWVHKGVSTGVRGQSPTYDPPAPKPHGRTGFLFLVVAYGRHNLEFSSPQQLRHFIDVLSMSPLPTSRILSKLRDAPVGPNSHWLSRLPAALKKPKERGQLVTALSRLPSNVWRATPNKSLERTRAE